MIEEQIFDLADVDMIPWAVRWASVAGFGHRARGVPCDDYSSCRVDGALTIAVAADGAGGYAGTHLGSRFVCEVFQDLIPTVWSDLNSEQAVAGFLAQVIDATRASLPVHAGPRALATTFSAFCDDGAKNISLFIGDGCFLVRESDGWRRLFSPWKGTYANETVFIDSPDVNSYVNILISDSSKYDRFILSTDGAEVLLMGPEGILTSNIDKLYDGFCQFDQEEYQQKLVLLLESERIANATDDDVTMVIGRRR